MYSSKRIKKKSIFKAKTEHNVLNYISVCSASVTSSWVLRLTWVVVVQESRSWVCSAGCLSSRPCRNTSSCAARTQQGACWINLASQYHTICTHTHTEAVHTLYTDKYDVPSLTPSHHLNVTVLYYVFMCPDPEISTTRVTAWVDSR